jgi:hypothetical protein
MTNVFYSSLNSVIGLVFVMKLQYVFCIVLPTVFLAYFAYFEKKNESTVCLCDRNAVYPPISTFEWLNQSLWNFINPSHQRVCLCILPIAGKQRLVKNITAATVKKSLGASFSTRAVQYENKVGD